jgi:hypothetical protein
LTVALVYHDIQYLDMSVQLNQSAVEAWVTLCNEEGRLKAEGASVEVLEAMRIRVAKALVAIIQESQAAALLEQILGDGPSPTAESTSEVGDPTHG